MTGKHVQEYKLQAFAGLKIAMSGIEPSEFASTPS
jgi:hypothetical protein